MDQGIIRGTALVPGAASGPVLFADTGLSFMGGVDPATGMVIDVHHPLQGSSVAGKILALPSGRGSCSGSLVIFELLMNGHAPKALIFSRKEAILTLGVMIAAEMFGKGIPVLRVSEEDFARLRDAEFAAVTRDSVSVLSAPQEAPATASLSPLDAAHFELTAGDRAILAGAKGEAAKLAMGLIIRAAQMDEANGLVDIDMGHIDGCFYHGPAGLKFAKRLLDLGAQVQVPTTMNAICVDRRQWQAQGVAASLGKPSDELAETYVAMGVKPTYTCAPYLLAGAPHFGQQIAWAESNAVVFANSVLGARTMKYPDYLDILVAITGRAPAVDCHVPEKRLATLRIDVEAFEGADDAFFPALGYHIGKIATNDIPVICGLENSATSHDDLKAFGAAFATTSAAPMFHIVGITPEAKTLEMATGGKQGLRQVKVSRAAFSETWRELNMAQTPAVDLVSLGNPHFSFSEIEHLARLCAGKRKHDAVSLVITCGRDVYQKAETAGLVKTIRDFGGTFLNDTCWCFIGEPVVPPAARNIMTNSGKYAHYGPAATQRGFHFGSLKACVDAACTSEVDQSLPAWLA